MGGESTMKNMVKRVKEIVHDFSDEEIHAMLEECDMDPNEAVQRLLVQDTFHEVKSKRERRKEVKETQELKFWGGSNISNWAANVDLDDGNFSNAYKKETASVTSSLSRSSYDYPSMAKAIGQKSSDMSASVNGENREPTRAGNVINSSMQSTTESKPPGLPTGGKNTSTADNVKVSPRWAEARSYLQDVMQRSEGYDSVHSNTKSGSGGASGCRHDLFEQISPRSQTICHQSSRDSAATAAVRAMSTSLESDHTSSESSEKVDGGVLLPSHVQSLAAECSNLTFGTYKTHSPSTNSGQHKSDLSVKEDGASMQQRYLPEHLLNDILESDNDLSGGNQEEVLKEQQNMGTSLGYESLPESDSISQYIQYDRNLDNSLPFQEVRSYSSDVLRNMESESSMESSRHLLRQQGMFSASYPPDEARYNAAVSYMKRQAISIPEKILGNDYRAAAKHPHQLIGPPSQYNHTRDRLGNWRDPPNTPQNYGHRLSDEHFCQYLAAAINKRQDHPLTSLVPSSIDASRFRSLANRRGSFLPNASIGSSAPPGFQSQFKNPNPFRRQIRSNPALDHRFRSRAMPNAQEQRAYDSSSVEAQQKYRYLVDNDLLHAFDSNLSLKPNNWRPNY